MDTFWLSGHPTLVHAPATVVSRSDETMVLRAVADGHEAEVEAPGH